MTTRNHEKIPYAEIEPLLNLVKNSCGSSESQVLMTIGYSNNAATDWRQLGMVPLRVKYGLLGLAAELKLKDTSRQKQFNFDELAAMFAALNGMDVPVERRQKLVKKLAAEMAA